MTTTFDHDPTYHGHEVVDNENHVVGNVTDVIYDDTTGEPLWLVVDRGLFRSERYVPIDGSYIADNGHVVIPFDLRWVKAAPKASSDHILTAPEESELDRHYDTRHGHRDVS